MAAIITSSFDVSYDFGTENACLKELSRALTSVGQRVTKLVQNVGFAAPEAVQLGEITNPGTLVLINLDATNFINVYTATSGILFAKLLPDLLANGTGGYIVIDRCGSGAQAPFVQAAVASCRMAVLVVEV